MATQTAPAGREALLSLAEVARLANVSLSTVRREIDRGELRARHFGRQLRMDPADFRTRDCLYPRGGGFLYGDSPVDRPLDHFSPPFR